MIIGCTFKTLGFNIWTLEQAWNLLSPFAHDNCYFLSNDGKHCYMVHEKYFGTNQNPVCIFEFEANKKFVSCSVC